MNSCRCLECQDFWHRPERPFRCEICSRRMVTSAEYFKHIKRHPVGKLARVVDRSLFGEPPQPDALPEGFHIEEPTN